MEIAIIVLLVIISISECIARKRYEESSEYYFQKSEAFRIYAETLEDKISEIES